MGKQCSKWCKQECSSEKWQLTYDNPDDFTTCFWQKHPGVPIFWLAYRATLVGVVSVAFWVVFFWPQEGFVWYKNFIYYTYWTYFLEITTFVLALGITVQRFRALQNDPYLPPAEVMPFYYKLTWLLYNISASCSFVVSIVFWASVYDPEINNLLGALIVNHILNVLSMGAEFCLNAFPFRLVHFYMAVIYTLIYGFFTIIYQLNGGTGNNNQIPIYTILDWRNPSVAIVTCGMQAACILIMHCALWAVHLLKCWVKKRFIDPKLQKQDATSGVKPK